MMICFALNNIISMNIKMFENVKISFEWVGIVKICCKCSYKYFKLSLEEYSGLTSCWLGIILC